MTDLRCDCGKIICQIDNKSIVIKCRHCKRLVVIKAEGQITIEGSENHLNNREIKEVISL